MIGHTIDRNQFLPFSRNDPRLCIFVTLRGAPRKSRTRDRKPRRRRADKFAYTCWPFHAASHDAPMELDRIAIWVLQICRAYGARSELVTRAFRLRHLPFAFHFSANSDR